MVLESLVVDILNKILGDYIENLDSKQLKIGIWSGDVVLHALKLRENALDDMDLPVKLVHGYVGKLVLKIPWKNLYSQPVIAEVSDFYLLVTPKQAVPYNAEKEAKYAKQTKDAALKSFEEAYKKSNELDQKKPNATFTEKLTAQIINNLQVSINNVHARYEDTSTTGRPFAFGASIYNLELYTTDNSWKKSYITEQVSRVFKIAKLDCLSVYMNCVSLDMFMHHDSSEFNELFRSHIATEENMPETYAYLFKPISSVARLKLNMTPEYDDPPFELPKIDLNLEINVLHVGLTSTQFQDILKLADNMNRMKLGAPYYKYRPYNKPYRGHYKEWWQFAITSILEVKIRRRNRECTWEYIKEHLSLCRTYAEQYKEFALSPKPSATLKASLDMLEERLDLFNLLLMRQRMQIDIDRVRKEEQDRKAAEAKKGWFSGWFGGGAQDSEDAAASYAKRLEAAMTEEEKSKLYKAIGYQENAVPLDLPEAYEAIKANFKLTSLEVGLYDDSAFDGTNNESRTSYEYDRLQNILLLELTDVTCDLRQRPAASALGTKIGIKEMRLVGMRMETDQQTTTIIKSQITEDNNLLDIIFETNPLDHRCDQSIAIRARPLQIIYHSATILRLIELFTPPKSVNLSEIEGAAAARISDFKERSATGMTYLIETHTRLEINIQFMPNIIIIPYKGVYVPGSSSVVVLSLGELLLMCKPDRENNASLTNMHGSGIHQSDILLSTMKRTYDTFEISIVDMQIVIAKPNEHWENIIDSRVSSDMHILRPTTIIVSCGLCIIDDDPRLPKTKVQVAVPALKVNLTEERVFEALKVFTSLPMPESEEPPLVPLKKTSSSTSSLRSITSFLGNLDKRNKKKSKEPKSLDVEIIQYTILDLSFALREFSVTLFNSTITKNVSDLSPQTESTKFGTPSDNSPTSPVVTEQFEDTMSRLQDKEAEQSMASSASTDKKLLKLQILLIEASLTKKTYELSTTAKLGAINLKQYDSHEENVAELNIINTPRFDKKTLNEVQKDDSEYLFTATYLQAQKNSPEFATKYNSTEQLINLKFSSLTVTLHQECLERLLEIADNLQRKVDAATQSLQKGGTQPKDRVGDAGAADEGVLSRLSAIAELATIGEVAEEEEDGNEDDDNDNDEGVVKENVRKARRKRRHRAVVESIKINIIANLEHVGVLITCRKRSIASLDVRHFDANVIMKSSYTELKLMLKDIIVTDLNPVSVHSSIMSIVGKSALDCQVIMYNLDETSDYNSDDMKISVNIGCIKIVFLNWFVTSVLSFLNRFQAAQQAIKDASAAAAETAKQNAINAYERASRIKLEIHIKAPIIIVPEKSTSQKAIALDLGSIILTNMFNEIQSDKRPESPAVIDELKLELKEMKLMKVNVIDNNETEKTIQIEVSQDTIDRVYGASSNINMFDPISMSLMVKRNLSSSWYRDLPEIDISGRLKTIELNLHQDDYALLMSIMNGNLNEGQDEFPPPPAPAPAPKLTTQTSVAPGTPADSKAPGKISKETKENIKEKPLTTKTNQKNNKIYEQMKFNFQFDGIVVNLLDELDDLARFGLYYVAIKGTKLIDGTLSASVVLCNLQIDDMRAKSQNKLTNYLCRKDWKSKFGNQDKPNDIVDVCFTERNFMVDLTAIIKENDTFAEIRICGFDLILSVEFLTHISYFMKIPAEQPQPQSPTSSITVPPTATAAPPTATAAPAATTTSNKDDSPKRPILARATSVSSAVVEQPDKKINFTIHIDEPDIILVESLDDINSNAIIFNMQAHLNYRAVGAQQTINGEIDSLKMYMCSFLPEKRAMTQHYIIHPCVISLQGSTPDEEGLHFCVKLSEIIINVSPATIELLNKALQTFNATNQEIAQQFELDGPNFRGIWKERQFEENEFWFLKADQAVDALALLDVKSTVEVQPEQPPTKSECCVLEVPSITLIVESGVGYYTTPLISIDTHLNAVATNWSYNLSVNGSLTLSMNYFNLALGVWEPIIELNEHPASNGEREFLPWELNFSVAMEKKQNEISEEEEQRMSIKIQSDENLEITLSKTCLSIISDLGDSFSQAIDKKGLVKPEIVAPYVLQNDTGFNLSVNFQRGYFSLDDCHIPLTLSNKFNRGIDFKMDAVESVHSSSQVKGCTIAPGGHVCLRSKTEYDLDNEEDMYHMFVQVGEIDKEIGIPCLKSDKRYFPLFRGANQDPWGIISEVRREFGTTIVNIHGVVNVHNHFATTAYIYRRTSKLTNPFLIGEIAPGKIFNVPLHAIYADNKELYFSISGYQTSVQGFTWNDSPTDLEYTRQLQCDPIETYEPLYLTAIRTKTEIFYEYTNKYKLLSAYYTIHLKPPLYLRNALPISIVVSVAGCSVRENGTATTTATTEEKPRISVVEDNLDKSEILDYGEKEVAPGNVLHLPTVKLSSTRKESISYLVLRLIQYLEKDWSCTTEISEEHENIETWKFKSYDSAEPMDMDLYVLFENRQGSLQLTLYSPFWMINKTGLMLSYRTDNANCDVLYHPPEYSGPILLSFREKIIFDKKQAVIRVDNGEWSEKIPLDVAGSIGSVTCKTSEQSYQIGVHNHLTNNSLTKHITFIPFYIITNKCDFNIELQELTRPGDPWLQISSNSCQPIWPKNDSNHMIITRVHGQITTPFKYSEAQCVLLKLDHNSYGGINVDVQTTEGGVYIVFTNYNPGDAAGLVINHTSRSISFYEEFMENKTQIVLHSKSCILYTWNYPMGERKISFGKEKVHTDLKRDDVGELVLADQSKAYWVSFLDGLQRVLLFTKDEEIVKKLETSASLQSFTQMIEVRIHGIGLSIINNEIGVDILYLGIASSGIIWEERKKNKRRYKTMKIHETEQIESLYQEYLIDKSVDQVKEYFLDAKYKVNFVYMTIEKPNSGKNIRRTFYPGVWLSMNSSPFQTQIHAKINRIQLDNQLLDCVFPVVLAPIPPPKSVAMEVSMKPFVECSIVQRVVPNSSVKQYKYASVLIQEFHFKVDLLFLTAVLEMFTSAQTDEVSAKLFNDDVALIEKPLSELVAVQSQQEQKNYYDNLHLGPLKIHVSFSMAGSSTTALPGILSTLVQGVGITLTDVHDVVFRLAFFERDYQFFTQRQLTSEISAHYTGQALKQLYVLVLGLDVLGDPYGLVVGLKKGVADLFYEPFQGAIQGPGEFAEGLCLGMKSLFGQTVGGAAGAVSKITGALGKGLAALTFDDDYQKKRRMANRKKPKTFQEGIARSSKGLVMGFVDGVTGVVKKPVMGAKEEGVEGFFKGLGKGAIGLIARPTAGVVDFASGSLDAVKRAAVETEDATRLRPPRFIYTDNILRPYCLAEAEGNRLLREVDKGKYVSTDSFAHLETIIDKKEYLLVTNHRVMYVTKNDLFASWNVEWTYLWEEIEKITSTNRGIELILKAKNKKILGMFSHAEAHKKLILIPDPKKRQKLTSILESQFNEDERYSA